MLVDSRWEVPAEESEEPSTDYSEEPEELPVELVHERTGRKRQRQRLNEEDLAFLGLDKEDFKDIATTHQGKV